MKMLSGSHSVTIRRGVEFLRSAQNQDGGRPAAIAALR